MGAMMTFYEVIKLVKQATLADSPLVCHIRFNCNTFVFLAGADSLRHPSETIPDYYETKRIQI